MIVLLSHLLKSNTLKGLLQAKGLQSTWDRLGNISATVDILKKLKKQVSTAMKTAYQGTTHKTPKTDHLVWRVANKVREEKLHSYKEDRIGNKKVKLVPDIIYVGRAKLISSSLKTFNRKIHCMVEGREYDDEADSLPQNPITILSPDSDEPSEDTVV